MNNTKLFFLAFFSFFLLQPTLTAQQSMNMVLDAQWDDNTLPTRSGFAYSDVWGYAVNGREFAIIGSPSTTIFMDVTVPTAPVEITRIAGGYPLSLWRDYKTYGHYAYGVADEGNTTNPSGLQIFDLSGLASAPYTVTKVYDNATFFNRCHNIFIDEATGHLYAVGCRGLNGNTPGHQGVIILDLNVAPANPTLLADITLTGGYIHDIYVRNDTGYCSHGGNGLYVYDFTGVNITNPTQLYALTSYPNQGYNHASWLSDDGDILIFADETKNTYLKVMDVSNFSNVSKVGQIKSTLEAPTATNSIPHNPFIKGDSCYISYYHDGIQIYDISTPSAPLRASYYDTHPTNTNYNGSQGAWGCYPFLPSGNILGTDIHHGLFVMHTVLPTLAIDELELFVQKTAQGARLNWQTDGSFDHFEIERKSNNSEFESIQSVEYIENQKYFEKTDRETPAGKISYRIKAIGVDGAALYSNIIQITADEVTEWAIYPSLATVGAPVYLRMNPELDKYVDVEIFNTAGELLKQFQKKSRPIVEIPMAGLLPGMYVVKLSGERSAASQKIVVR